MITHIYIHIDILDVMIHVNDYRYRMIQVAIRMHSIIKAN